MSRGVRVLRICGGGGGGGRQGWVVKHSLVHCMTVSGFPGLLLDASSILPLSPPHTHTQLWPQKCLHSLPRGPWGARSPAAENEWHSVRRPHEVL